MKRVLNIAIMVLLAGGISAQQLPQYSQYMFNGLVLNPAYAGIEDQLSVMALAREQWTGVNGAPSTQSIFFHTPSGNLKNGFGLSVVRDRIAVTTMMDIGLSYAYRINIDKETTLSFGLEGSLRHLSSNLNGVRTGEASDAAFQGVNLNEWMPNFGTGVYLRSSDFFVGFSVPEIMEGVGGRGLINGSNFPFRRHYLITGGLLFGLAEGIDLQPFTLIKVANGAPVSADINANLIINERLRFGLGYRTQDAVVANVQYRVSDSFRFGYAFDYTIGALGPFTTGSHELMLGYDLVFTKMGTISPRRP